MSQVHSIRPGVVAPGGAAPTRVLLILEPKTSPGIADAARGDYLLSVEPIGIEAVSATTPGLRRAEVIIVEVDPFNPVMFDEFEAFAREYAGKLPVIAGVRDLTVAATRLVLRAGAVDVLPLPFTAEEFAHTVDPAREQALTKQAVKPVKRGKIISFLGAIGGCGTTALATQAGIIWAASAKVCLIDLDVQFGNAALYLDLKPKLGVFDVIEAGDRLDAEVLQTIAEQHASGLSVVASPPDMVPLDMLSTELVEKMLELAMASYDIVLVDLPAAWTNWSLRVIEMSELTLMVTSLSVPGIHQAKRQAEVIDGNGMSDRLRVVVNRVTHPMFGKIDLSDTQALMGRRIDYAIANDYPTVSSAIDRGKPFAAKTRVEKDLRAMVGSLAASLLEKAAL
ncbi:AAA family ATPase [Sphingosinicellaceae bacterium]|nr:AAA family ATPase [Sphingosinicellaceae bacterium]